MEISTSQVLFDAFNLLEQPGKWTKQSYAKNKAGLTVDVSNAEATCFCSLGALYRVSNIDQGSWPQPEAERFLHEAADSVSGKKIACLNDEQESFDSEPLINAWITAMFLALAEESESESIQQETFVLMVDAKLDLS